MSDQSDPKPGINSWFEEELRQQYSHDHSAVDSDWRTRFDGAPASTAVTHAAPSTPARALPTVDVGPSDQLMPLRGVARKIAANMDLSLTLPLATSQRVIPVKVIDENRQLINQHRAMTGKSKVSYTHMIAWAIIKALGKHPGLNNAFTERDGESFRVVRNQINFGLAVDVEGRDGSRNLLVPNIKDAGSLDFAAYMAKFDDLVARARKAKLTPDDFSGTTISLTNPGTVGTLGSTPRLMPGQGAIIATGAIDFPPGYQGVSPELRATIGISKVMTVTCTYDHRIIQGAESGMFLGTLQSLLEGKDQFYEEIFAGLRVPHRPVSWASDRSMMLPGQAERYAEVAREAAVIQLINAYRVRGHLVADLDPLGIEPHYHPELDPATYGLTIWDLDRQFLTGSLSNAIGEGAPVAPLREILEKLRQTYCSKIGAEFMYIQHPEEKRWLEDYMEPRGFNWPVDREHRVHALETLAAAEEFEHFLHTRFIGQKRFALEGGEAAMAILDEIATRAADQGVHEIVMGMAHRGRLNVLCNIVGKPYEHIFHEFEGNVDPMSAQGSGDVKYHLGASGVRRTRSGKEVVISLAPNPSHLEAVNPVVEGIVRPKQDRLGDVDRKRVIPLLIHGDAAFAGQGVVAETLNLSQLKGYRTGGTVHLIINNQIGFTTLPESGRSTNYSTDVARMVQAPIFHVNGDDPDACVRVAQIAFDYRQRFGKDVVIDMICYRRHGHNEGDDPSYTQPVIYRKIKDHPSVGTLYAERLVREAVVDAPEVQQIHKRVQARLNEAFDAAKSNGAVEKFEPGELVPVPVEELDPPSPKTNVERDIIAKVVDGLTRFPADFHLHPKLKGFTDKRKDAFDNDGPVDWAFAEALAFGTMVVEGIPVRLSGQDSGRGTFSQRHLCFYDAEDGHRHIPMKFIAPEQATFHVFDSSLSEYAVLGFEFGFSVADPLTMVIWEAQFGDFMNGAQIMIDQFIATCEQKWGQPTGLVMLLPHGYEGQGPEHSSARIERFLTLCAENNLQLINATTASQYFHVLRRQMHGGKDRRGLRKPMVMFTPKSLLRSPLVTSSITDLVTGSFREVLGETGQGIDPSRVRRVVFCSGKVYYDLLAERDKRGISDVALVRVEQLYPFPEDQINDQILRYPVTADVVWTQEEPRNMGSWTFLRDRIQALLAPSKRDLSYCGRLESASPATGSLKRHQQEQAELVDESLTVGAAKKIRAVPRRRKS